MKDMMNAFANQTDKGEIPANSGDFKQNLERYASSVADDFHNREVDMDESIAKIAQSNSLNDEQIQRIVEESNNKTFLMKYAEKKTSNERDIVFKTASVGGVKEKMGSGDTLAKIASCQSDAIDSFNSYTPYKTGAMTPSREESLIGAISEKIASDLSEVSKGVVSANRSFDAHIYKVAEMLIRYDRAGIDTDSVFKTMCKDASLRSPIQEIIKTAAQEIITEGKIANHINSDYQLNLPFVDLLEEERDFSLGEFSGLDKSAEYFPIMQVGETVIRNISDMVKLASEIKSLFDNVSQKELLFKEATEKANFEKVGV